MKGLETICNELCSIYTLTHLHVYGRNIKPLPLLVKFLLVLQKQLLLSINVGCLFCLTSIFHTIFDVRPSKSKFYPDRKMHLMFTAKLLNTEIGVIFCKVGMELISKKKSNL